MCVCMIFSEMELTSWSLDQNYRYEINLSNGNQKLLFTYAIFEFQVDMLHQKFWRNTSDQVHQEGEVAMEDSDFEDSIKSSASEGTGVSGSTWPNSDSSCSTLPTSDSSSDDIEEVPSEEDEWTAGLENIYAGSEYSTDEARSSSSCYGFVHRPKAN